MTTMAALQVEEPGAADGDPPVPRDLSPVEVAKLESLRTVCNLRVGQPADDRGAVVPAAPAAPGPLLPTRWWGSRWASWASAHQVVRGPRPDIGRGYPGSHGGGGHQNVQYVPDKVW